MFKNSTLPSVSVFSSSRITSAFTDTRYFPFCHCQNACPVQMWSHVSVLTKTNALLNLWISLTLYMGCDQPQSIVLHGLVSIEYVRLKRRATCAWLLHDVGCPCRQRRVLNTSPLIYSLSFLYSFVMGMQIFCLDMSSHLFGQMPFSAS